MSDSEKIKKKKDKQVIKIADLRQAINDIFDHIQKDLQTNSFELDEDYYWDILEGVYDPSLKAPSKLGFGSLYDDWDFLAKMPKDQAVPPMLTHVWPLLRYMSDNVPWYNKKS